MDLFILSILLFNQQLMAQYGGYMSELYFGRQPSARSEAMGKSMDLFAVDANTSFFNPANLARLQGVALNTSYAEPYYLAEKSYFTNYSLALSMAKYGALAINRFDWDFGSKIWVVTVGGNDAGRYRIHNTIYTLNYARPVMKNLLLGLNLNLVQHSSNETFNSWPIDLGAIRQFDLWQDNALQTQIALGAAFYNIFKAESSDPQKDELPQLLKVGFSGRLNYVQNPVIKDMDLFNIIINIQYHNLLNSAERKSIRTGAEIALMQLLFLRAGYYYETLARDGYAGNEDHLEETTYGFGVQLPLQQLGIIESPFYIRFDYASLQQPSYTKMISDWDDFKIWSIIIRWDLNVFDNSYNE